MRSIRSRGGKREGKRERERQREREREMQTVFFFFFSLPSPSLARSLSLSASLSQSPHPIAAVYVRALQRQPLLTKSATSAVLNLLEELFSQVGTDVVSSPRPLRLCQPQAYPASLRLLPPSRDVAQLIKHRSVSFSRRSLAAAGLIPAFKVDAQQVRCLPSAVQQLFSPTGPRVPSSTRARMRNSHHHRHRHS